MFKKFGKYFGVVLIGILIVLIFSVFLTGNSDSPLPDFTKAWSALEDTAFHLSVEGEVLHDFLSNAIDAASSIQNRSDALKDKAGLSPVFSIGSSYINPFTGELEYKNLINILKYYFQYICESFYVLVTSFYDYLVLFVNLIAFVFDLILYFLDTLFILIDLPFRLVM